MADIVQSQLNKSKKDKFLLSILPPTILKPNVTSSLKVRNKDVINNDSLQFSVYGSVIPEINVPAVVAGYSGQAYKLSSNNRTAYEDITVDFTVDNRFNNYWVIYKWLQVLNDDKKSFYDAKHDPTQYLAPLNYQSDLSIIAMDEFDVPTMKFTYTKAFPVKLGGINYNYRDSEDIASSFTFAFSQFFAEPV